MKKLLTLYLPIFTFLLWIAYLIKKQDNLEKYEAKMLQNSKSTIAIIKHIKSGAGVRHSANCDLVYYEKNKRYSFNNGGDFTMLEIGDTVEIIFSTIDHNVAKVTNKYFMKKYHH